MIRLLKDFNIYIYILIVPNKLSIFAQKLEIMIELRIKEILRNICDMPKLLQAYRIEN